MCKACASPKLNNGGYIGSITDLVSIEMANAVRAQIADVSGAKTIALPSRIYYRIWDVDSNLASHGVHTWMATGARWWQISEQLLQPRSSEAVHIVGEAFSSPSGQGWIAGALETVERMLTLKVGLPPLSGLTREDICIMNPFSDTQLPKTTSVHTTSGV